MACFTVSGYSQPGKYWANLDERADNVESLFAMGWGVTVIGMNAARMQGADPSSFQAANTGFAGARATIAFARLPRTIEKIATGDIVRETDDQGNRVWKNWLDIALQVALAVGRFFSPVLWLHNMKAINLGKHAGWVGNVVVSAFSAVVSFGAIASIRDLFNECNKDVNEDEQEKHLYEIRKQVAYLLRSFADLLALPWEMGVGLGGHPVLAIVGGSLCTLSAGLWVISDWMFYEPDAA